MNKESSALGSLAIAALSLVSGLVGGTGCLPPVTAAGYAAADGKAFAEPAKYPGQDRGDGVSLVVEPQLEMKSEDAVHDLTLRPFYRLDPNDERRSHADLRQANYKLAVDNFQAGVGLDIFTWGVLESYKPTDVMNQTDFVEAFDGSQKLGQPYGSLGWVGESMALKLYYLPYFQDRTFQGLRGRPRFSVPIDTDDPIYATKAGKLQPSAAARFTFNVGDFDFGVGLFTGLSREPRFVAELSTGEISPRYDLMHQASADGVWTLGAFVLKAEGFYRLWGPTLRKFAGGGAGADYTFFKVIEDVDFSLAAEFLFDTRPIDAPPTFYNHDGFLGARIAINDTANTEILAGALVDVLDQSTFGKAGISRRFGEHWRVSLDINVFLGPHGKLESAFLHDDYAHARIAYFF